MAVKQGGFLRIYRPGPAMWSDIGWLPYFKVLIDGADRGDLWAKQVKVFEVEPGDHELRLKVGFVLRSRRRNFHVEVGQIAEFACWPQLLNIGPIALHAATERERRAMRDLVATGHPPTNLADLPPKGPVAPEQHKAVGWPGGVSPPGSLRSRRESLLSPGSSHLVAVSMNGSIAIG